MAKFHVLWSGGLDSTYLITKLLSEGHDVSASYCEIKGNVHKTSRELKAIEVLRSLIQHPNFKYAGTLLSVDVYSGVLTKFSQMPVWMLALLCSGGTSSDYVAVGYCMADQAISHLDDLKSIWKSYESLTYTGKLPELVFPLAKVDKRTMVEELSEEVFAATTWCEGINAPCGKCPPCWRRMGMELMGDIPKHLHVFNEQVIKEILEREIRINKEPVTIEVVDRTCGNCEFEQVKDAFGCPICLGGSEFTGRSTKAS